MVKILSSVHKVFYEVRDEAGECVHSDPQNAPHPMVRDVVRHLQHGIRLLDKPSGSVIIVFRRLRVVMAPAVHSDHTSHSRITNHLAYCRSLVRRIRKELRFVLHGEVFRDARKQSVEWLRIMHLRGLHPRDKWQSDLAVIHEVQLVAQEGRDQKDTFSAA
jgi:hypothetical protein